MKKINTRTNIKWLNPESSLTLHETSKYEFDKALVTSVFCFIIKDQKVAFILNKKPNRGYEIPGGHVEKGEDVEQALKRECLEEACIKIDEPKLIAIHEINNPKADGIYPKRGYQCFYVANVKTLKTFTESDEISERLFLTKEEVLKLEWAKYYPDLINIFLKHF